uniref:Virulence plasmid integrase pGP8-D n=1 Tax=Talaromyces marneffei PM1 TaxID=1077442 RepID=A0A093VU63_TALMA
MALLTHFTAALILVASRLGVNRSTPPQEHPGIWLHTQNWAYPKMKGKRKRNIDSITMTVDLNEFTNSIPKRHVIPYTQSKYDTTLEFFDQYYKLHADATIPPNFQTLKSFLAWISKLMEGRIKESPRGTTLEGTQRLLPCVDSMRSFLRSFLTAWARAERPDIANSVASMMVHYVKGDMLEEGKLSSAEMPKPCLSPNDLTALLTHLWCNDNYSYRGKCADRQRVALNFATLVYCFTSARTGELYESLCRRQVRRLEEAEDNLEVSAKAMTTCYKHFLLSVEVVEGVVMLVLSYLREFVKDARNKKRWELPLHVFYETYVLDQPLMFNPILFFLALASADGVFENYPSVDDILDKVDQAEKDYPGGHPNDSHVLFKFHMREDIAEIPILRPVSELKIEDATGRGRGADAFNKQFAELGHRAGYPDRVTARACRRWALMEADRNGTENDRMKLAGHRDPNQFRRSYAHPLSDIDGQASYLGIRDRRGHITNRRGMEIHKNQVTWETLPALREFEFEERKDVAALQDEIDRLKERSRVEQDVGMIRDIDRERRRLERQKKLLYGEEVQRFNRTNSDTQKVEACQPFHYTRRAMPDRDLLAQLLPQPGKLRSIEGRQAARALENLCVEDTTVSYRRCLRPTDDKCGACQQPIEKFYPHRRWYHLYHCYQTKLSILGNDKFADFFLNATNGSSTSMNGINIVRSILIRRRLYSDVNPSFFETSWSEQAIVHFV